MRHHVLAGILSAGLAACDRELPVEIPEGRGDVDVHTRLAELCELPRSAVFFDRDSARLLPAARERLRAVARCVLDGTARGQGLRLIGHTSPFGTDRENQRLGLRRAEAVARELRALGLPADRVTVESRGEAGASPSSYDWELERRVTLRLRDLPR